MRLLLALLLLPVTAFAQQQTVRNCPDETAIGKSSSNWANCDGETWELPAPELIVSVRPDDTTNPTWQRASEAIVSMPAGLIVVCTKLPVGSTSDCGNTRARLDSLNWGGQPEPPDPTVPPTAGSVVISWTAVSSFTDDSPIPDPSAVEYRIESSVLQDGPWSGVWSGGATSATVSRESASAYVRVLTGYSGTWSLPSDAVSVPPSPASQPNAPVIVGDSPRALSLVAGATGATRAVYSKSATGSRGIKLGDLDVGPATITDYARMECDIGDSFTQSGTRYARVSDARAPQALRAGYVSGCAYVGMH